MSHEITPAIKIYNVSRGLSETANCAHEFFRGHSHCEIPLHGVFSNADTDSINVHSYVKQMPQNIQIFLHANARKLFQRRHSNKIHKTVHQTSTQPDVYFSIPMLCKMYLFVNETALFEFGLR